MPNSKADDSGVRVRLTKISATGRATKQHALNGETLETASAPNIFAGAGEVLILPARLEALRQCFAKLGPNECVTYGVPRDGIVAFDLTTKARRAQSGRETLARCRDDFEWGDGLGVFFLDHDPGPDGKLTPGELRALLVTAVPSLACVRWVVVPSSSSNIRRAGGGEILRDMRGYHLYAFAPAKLIPELASYLRDALAAVGDVRFDVSAAGSLLERYAVDFAVHQPERVDYAAPPVVGPGLELFGRDPRFIGGDVDVIDVGALPPLTAAQLEAARANREAARAAKEGAAREVREARIGEEVARLVEIEQGTPPERASELARAMFERGELHVGAQIVVIEGGREVPVTVREILEDRARFDRALTLDPLEPDYRGRKVVGILYLDDPLRSLLFSQAHGGRAYTLSAKPRIELRSGELETAVERLVDLMVDGGDFYSFGGRVAVVEAGAVVVLAGSALAHEIERRIEVRAWKTPRGRPGADGAQPRLMPASLPREAVDRITQNSRLVGRLPRLAGVRGDPLLTPDGRWIGEPGYDGATGLWMALSAPVPKPAPPDDGAILGALSTLLAPLRSYKFASSGDRSVALLALLTALARPALPLAPGFLITAAMRGSGKTKLAEVVGTIAGGFSMTDLTGSRDEAAKRVDAFLMGGAPCLLADNLTTGDELDRPDIASLLTSERKSIRPFGSNAGTVEVETGRLVLATANNPRVRGDAVRRVLPIRLEPAGVTPHLVAFAFDPVREARRDRGALVGAALVLLLGGTGTSPGAVLGSFDVWSAFVGGALDRAVGAGADGLDDFASVIGATAGIDPLGDAIREFIDAIDQGTGAGVVDGLAVSTLGATMTDAFGRRDATGKGVNIAAAMDELAAASGAGHGVWDGRGVFSPKLAGAIFSKLDGVLFERDGMTWVWRYAQGRRRRMVMERV